MERRLRRGESLAVVAVLIVMAAILFWPTPVDAPIGGALSRVLAVLHTHGVPHWLDYRFVELTANVVLFVPLGAIVASVMMRPLWWVSGLAGLCVSLIVEFTQTVFLPHRFGSVGDLAANTIGALIGGGIAVLALDRRTRSAQARTSSAVDRSPSSSGI